MSSRSTSRRANRSARARSSSAPASAVSPSTVRGELAELEALGLLTHPHTSAGRTPTESGYRIYAEELVDTLEGRPDELGVDLRSMRDEIEQALRMTTEMLSDATRLLALVSAPSLETASIRHIEVLTLQPTSVMVVVITSTGGVTKRVFRLDEPVDPGLVAWAGEYLEEQLVGERLGSSAVRRRLEAPELAPRERAFLALIGQTLLEVGAEAGPEVFVGGAAGLVEGARVEEVEATMRLVELLERRAAVLALVSARRSSRSAPSSTSGRSSPAPSSMPSRSSARRTGSARRRSAPSASSARCAWTTRRRSAPFAQRRSSSRASSRTSTKTPEMAMTEADYYELLGVSRTASDAEIKQSFRTLARELHPDVSSEPDADRRFRDVAEAYEVLSDPERRATYDRYGKAGLKRGGYEPGFADFGSVADIFAAFFGEDLLGGGGGRQRSQRGGDVQAVVEIELEEAFAGASVDVPLDVALPCERCDATGAEPGTSTRTCPTCAGAGAVRSVSQNIFGQFVQQRTCPDCGGAGEVLEQSVRRLRRRGPCRARDGSSRSTFRRGSTTASRSACAARGMPASAAPSEATRSSSSASVPIRDSCETETTCTRPCG